MCVFVCVIGCFSVKSVAVFMSVKLDLCVSVYVRV